MGLWQILKGEQPGLIKSILHYRNAGQFGEYLIDYALQSEGVEGERVVLTKVLRFRVCHQGHAPYQ